MKRHSMRSVIVGLAALLGLITCGLQEVYSIETSFGELNPLRVKGILLVISYSNSKKKVCLKSLYSVPESNLHNNLIS